jgi:alkaline phosphatase D
MEAKALSVGPILGHTSTDLVRIFGRAELAIDNGKPRKTHGVIHYRVLGQLNYSTPYYFKMNPNFDLTGVAVLRDLQDDTNYEYQMGWLYSDVDTDLLDVSSTLNWSNIETYQFKTASSDSTKQRTLVFGSCRYVLRLFGGMWWDDRGDKTFKSIYSHSSSNNRIDQMIMCGDQIYADDLNALGADDSLDEYNERYRKVFTTNSIRKLMASTPTYMTLDDHEIEDNWPEAASKKDWLTKFPPAIHAYTTYQASHSPLFELNGNRITGTPTHLWYSYSDGCCDVFVCDTRTERSLDSSVRQMIGPRQLQALLDWLKDDSGKVKVVVTSIPPYESESDDKWHGFIEQRDEIFECIRNNDIQRVVFLSGDVHACMASQLDVGNNVTVTSIVSSAFFWPYPHPNRNSFKLSGQLDTKTNQQYKVMKASKVFPTDAFTKLKVYPDKLKVEFYSRKNEKLGTKSFNFLG